jgi:acetolactate synthase-1/2/3 large subunit
MIDTTEHVYPMVGPGLGYRDMITGKYIPSRTVAPVDVDEPGEYF